MIQSMTGYARYEHKADWGTATWEVRSVNQRYLETFFRLPENFRSLENALRDKFRKNLQRGKVECKLYVHMDETRQSELSINEELAKSVIASAKWVSQHSAAGQLNPIDVLKWPGVVNADEQDTDALQKEVLKALDATIAEFIENRKSEGSAIDKMLQERLDGVSKQEVLQWQRERLLTRFEEAKIELDPQRVEQEMIMLAQKVDVAEELDRLDAHVEEARKILKKGGPCGRRLDFMMQEFNREANTLASKSINADITAAAVDLKVLIEQMREQIQNLE